MAKPMMAPPLKAMTRALAPETLAALAVLTLAMVAPLIPIMMARKEKREPRTKPKAICHLGQKTMSSSRERATMK